MAMRRRTFLGACGGAIVLAACRASRAESPRARAPAADAWPGPTQPRSYVTNPPPPVGSRLELSDDEWRRRLTREQYAILRTQRTEPAFSCELWQEHRTGTFYCAGCGAPLFHSRDKFDSGTGWASFMRPIEPGRIGEERDTSFGMVRVEVHCARCDGHMGHVFDDGPPPTRQRYCINGSVLEFVEGS